MRKKTNSSNRVDPPLTLHNIRGSKVHTIPSVVSQLERVYVESLIQRQSKLLDHRDIRFLETSTSRTLRCPLDIPCRKGVRFLNLRLVLNQLSKTKRLTSLALLSTIPTLSLSTTKTSPTGLAQMLEETCLSHTATCILARAVTTHKTSVKDLRCRKLVFFVTLF